MSANRLGLALVLACFCLPLFVGLGKGDFIGDEAGHAFSVDRMLETGDWLVPRSSPQEDFPFLEKPPLKFWIVALPVRLGLLPHDEFGFRFWDALFGAVGFVYVYAIGCRLAGEVCGFVAVMTLFAFWPLVFDHGLRSNNMEAPLLLCYCAGTYHYMKWTSSSAERPRAGHVAATVLFFVLGFMTKFVAALFLPLVLGVTTLAITEYRERFVRDRRLWTGGILLGAALIAPWFLYAYHRFGSELTATMLESQVVTRMTSYLNPSHVKPWPFYFVSLYQSLSYAGAAVLVLGGTVLLAVQAARRRWAEGFVVLLWLALPLVLISFGSSKLMHYTYPFVPPLALAGGYLAALVAMLAPAPLSRIEWPRILLFAVAALAIVLALATFRAGELRLELGGTVVLRNSSVYRPGVIALLAAVLAGGRRYTRLATLLLVALLAPAPAYAQNLARLDDGHAPLRTLRDCLIRTETTTSAPPGLYVDVPDNEMWHPVYYYFRRVRPWTRVQPAGPARLAPFLDDPSGFRPVLIARSRYDERSPEQGDGSGSQPAAVTRTIVSLSDYNLLVLLPGPYASCRTDALESGQAR